MNYIAKIRTRDDLEKERDLLGYTDAWGWWSDVCPGSKIKLRDATPEDLTRCSLREGSSTDPKDWLCEHGERGSLVARSALLEITPDVENKTGIDVANTALHVIGTTQNPRAAGYLMTNGELLDFSGSKDAPNSSEVFRDRALDHRTLGAVLDYHPELRAESATQTMYNFMSAAGAMRFGLFNQHAVVHWIEKPLREQVRALCNIMSEAQVPLIMKISDVKGNELLETELNHGSYDWERLFEIDTEARKLPTADIGYVLECLGKEMADKDDDSAENGHCAEFALALVRVLNLDEQPEEETLLMGVRSAYDKTGEFLYETLSHWTVCPNGKDVYDWQGANADVRWEEKWDPETFIDEDGETSEFEWKPVSPEDLTRNLKSMNAKPLVWEKVYEYENRIRETMEAITPSNTLGRSFE